VQGTTGVQGIQGRQGVQGATGSQGTTGTQGTLGTQGATGPTGGSNTQILYNSSGTATGSANMTFDGTRPTFATLRTNNILPTGGLPAGATGGGIIQCVQTIKTSATTFVSSTYADVSGMSVTITPRTSSNKVLIIVQFAAQMNSWYGSYGEYRILRASTAIGAEPFGVNYNYSGGSGDNYADFETVTFTYVDSPATTSATTYKLQAKNSNSRNMWINSGYDGVTKNCSTIIAMEVSG
jgi:hypothetical protein